MLKSRSAFSSLNEHQRFIAACGWFLFIATAAWAIFFVPMNMDEALPYHPLACAAHPFASLHVFEEGCDGRYDLTVFFGLRIPGAYHYVGSFSALLYAPVYFLFHAPAAQYWFGLAFFFGFAWLLSGFMPRRALSLPLILSFFPFIFQFIHDTGPVKFSMLLFPLGAILTRACMNASPLLRYGYAVVLAMLVMLAIEDKVFFIYLLPSFVCFCLAFLDAPDWRSLFTRLRKCSGALILAALIVVAGIATLLFATMGEHTYLWHLTHVQMHLEKQSRPGTVLITCILLILAWPAYAHRVFDMEMINILLIIASILFAGIFILVCFIIAWRRKMFLPLTPRTELLMFSIFAALIVFLGPSRVWAGHHFVFLWIPAFVLFADFLDQLKPKAFLAVTLSFFALSAYSVLALTQSPMSFNMSPEREAIFSYFDDEKRAEESIVNYSSWGGYFIHSLYAPKNLLVTYIDPLDKDRATKLFDIARRTHRRIYDVCLDQLRGTAFEGLPITVGHKAFSTLCGKTFLDDRFAPLDFEEALPGLRIWHLWEGKAP